MAAGAPSDPLVALAQVDLTGFEGLVETSLEDLAARVPVDTAAGGRGRLGTDRVAARWIPVEAPRWEAGLRAWLDADHKVVVLEGRHPVSADGQPAVAPDLGAPEDHLAARLGRLHLDDAEEVHAGRGLAMQVNPDNGLLLAVFAFAPTTPRHYRTRLRPQHDAVPAPMPRRIGGTP